MGTLQIYPGFEKHLSLDWKLAHFDLMAGIIMLACFNFLRQLSAGKVIVEVNFPELFSTNTSGLLLQ